MRREMIAYRVLFGKLKERDRWEEVDVAGRILLKWILNK